MKLLNPDGSEYGEAPAWLTGDCVPVGAAFVAVETHRWDNRVAFVRLSHGLRFYAPRDRELWRAAVEAGWAR